MLSCVLVVTHTGDSGDTQYNEITVSIPLQCIPAPSPLAQELSIAVELFINQPMDKLIQGLISRFVNNATSAEHFCVTF